MAQFFSAVVATPGTPQPLCGTTVPAQAAITGNLTGKIAPHGSCIQLQAAAGNTAGKSIFVGCASMSVSGLTGIGIKLLPGEYRVLQCAGVDLSTFFIDTDSTSAATEKVFAAVL